MEQMCADCRQVLARLHTVAVSCLQPSLSWDKLVACKPFRADRPLCTNASHVSGMPFDHIGGWVEHCDVCVCVYLQLQLARAQRPMI